nr:MAG TPA: winged helix-turn-helix DNA-binding protein [Caudoviricetes sp.]
MQRGRELFQNRGRQKKERFTFLRLPTQVNICFGGEVNLPNLARLTMLSTYVRYSEHLGRDDNILVVGQTKSQRPMRKKDMREVLQLSQKSFSTFFADMVKAGALLPLADKSFAINSNLFFRGKVPTGATGKYTTGTVAKVFADRYRLLFRSNLKDVKEIGLVLRLAPFISRHYDVLCHDPYESDINVVRRLSMTDICRLVGMDVSHASRYRRRLEEKFADIAFEYNGTTHNLCTVREHSNGKKFIHVNPSVISF